MLWLTVLMVCSCAEKKVQPEKAPIRVATEIVSADASRSHLAYVGIVEECEATAVSFTSMGVVKRVLVGEGQTVSKGQLLAQMDSAQAHNMLLAASAQAAQANDALARYRMLHEAGSLPEIQWVEVQSKVSQAQAQLEIAQKNLQDCRLIAPVSGIVGKVMVKAGETALPSQAVVSILDISTVKVKVAVPEAEIGTIDRQTPSTIQVDAIGACFEGGRIEKGIVADALTHTYDIRVHVANQERRLLPGMVASVLFAPTDSLPTALTVPLTAVQKKADGTLFVWVVADDNTAHRTPVSVGETTGNRVTVSGLDAVQRIVTEGYQKLSEGTKVVF